MAEGKAASGLSAGVLAKVPVFGLLGFAFVEAWTQTLFSNRFASAMPQEVLPMEVVHLAASLGAVAVALLAACLAGRLTSASLRRDWAYAAGSVGALASAGILAVGAGFGGAAWLAPLNIVVSATSIWLVVSWYVAIAGRGALALLVTLAGSAVLSSILYALLMVAPPPVAVAVIVALPIASAFGLRLLSADERVDGPRGAAHPASLAAEAHMSLMVLAALGCFFSGIVSTLDLSLGVQMQAPSLALDLLARAAVMVAAALIAIASLRRGVVAGACASIALMMVAAMMLAFALHPIPNAASSVARIGSESMSLIVLGVLVRRSEGNVALLVFSVAALAAARFVGTFAGQLAVVGVSGNHTYLGVLLLADLVFTAMALMLARPWLAPPARLMKSGSESAAESFAARYHLTQREREVLVFWIGGHTSAYIEEALCISKHTVKTHLKNIYAKTGAANKESLIVLYEQESKH